MFSNKDLIKQYELRMAETVAAYEARISELKSQITDLKKLVFSSTSSTHIPLVSLEADAVLSQKDETIFISEEEMARIQDVEAEASRILSGNY